MKEHPAIQGSGAAIITPFDPSGKVDLVSLKSLVSYWKNGGLDCLVVLGTTGESVTLTKSEKKLIIDTVIEENDGQCALVLGIGGNNTNAVCDELKETDLSHFEAVLSVAPYYNKPGQSGLFEHYRAVSEASPKPVILYNVPGRTGVNMTADTTLRLAEECKNICAVKEASGNLEQIMQIIKNRPEHFLVLSGDDSLTLAILAAGGNGVISVIANAFPQDFDQMVHLAMEGNIAEARTIHYRLFNLMQAIFKEGNPAGVKALLKIMGKCDEYVRLPLTPVGPSLFEELELEYNKLR